jgi:hypothetical protein
MRNCSELAEKDRNAADNAIAKVVQHPAFPADMQDPGNRKIFSLLQNVSSYPWYHISALFRLLFAMIAGKSEIADGVVLNRRKKQWELKDTGYTYPFLLAYRKQIKSQTGYHLSLLKRSWFKPDKNPLAQNRCSHLHDAIATKFNLPAPDSDWQHWNGGVFVFDQKSHSFLDEWHAKTLEIFNDPYWKTRDQGTLIATAISQQLTGHPTLSKAYNFIADFYKTEIKADLSKPGTFFQGRERLTPSLIHIYHHFGNTAWDVWQAIEALCPQPDNKPELLPDNKIVHALWIGEYLSDMELMTIRSFIHQGHSFYLWLYKPLKTPLPEGTVCMDAAMIIPEERIFRYRYKNQFGHGKGSLGGFSDIFRYKLLFEHGGWWTDMDMTCLKPLNFTEPYVFRTHQILTLVGNLMKCPPKSELMRICYERAFREVNADNRDWHKPIQILADEVKFFKLENYIRDFTNPDSWKLIRKMLVGKTSIPKHWYAIHWVNEEWKRNKVNKKTVVPDSVFGDMISKYGLMGKSSDKFSLLKYRLSQTYLIAGFRQLPWFIKRNFIR